MMESPAFEFSVSNSGRADQVLRLASIPGACFLSRSHWRELFANGAVRRVNKSKLRAGDRVQSGDIIKIYLDGFQSFSLHPVPGEVDLIAQAQDYSWLVFAKPCDLPTLPLKPWTAEGYANRIARFLQEREIINSTDFAELGPPPKLEGGLTHRLDNHTTGALVVATNAQVKKNIREAFSSSLVNKTYLAIVSGRPPRHWQSELEILADARGTMVRETGANSGGSTCTIDTLKESENAAVVRVRISSGIRHQVRAVLAFIGHPLLADLKYGADAAATAAWPERLQHYHLHAESVNLSKVNELAPPLNSAQANFEFISELPPSFAEVQHLLGL